MMYNKKIRIRINIQEGHMKKIIINTDKSPAAIGPYSQGVEVGSFLFTSGQVPIDAGTGQIPRGIEKQTEKSLLNIKGIIEAAGSGMNDIIKTTVYITDMNNFTAMNEVYKSFFEEGIYPARSCVEVSRLPKDALVEIEAVVNLRR
jgi:2-iminobutanoate/2-iminopropanoate deaminase